MSSKQMRAAVYHGAGDIRTTDLPIPDPGPGELLLRVAVVGICGTDAHEYESGSHMFPTGGFVPGHEFAGQVVAVGEGVAGFGEGDLVACGAGVSCGRCRMCLKGATNHCATYLTHGLQLPGALAQYVAVPASICLEVGSLGLSPDVAALAQPMSSAVHARRRGRAASGEDVVVIGAGGIGAFLTYALAQLGAAPVVVDLDRSRLDIAGRLGADGTSTPESLPDTGGTVGPSVIYEVSGTAAGLGLAISLAVDGTRVVAVGLQDGATPIGMRRISLREIELVGSNSHVFAADFPEAVRLLSTRESWSDVAPVAILLDDLVGEGLQPMVEGRVTRIKTLIDPWTEHARPTV
ncbi:MAG TPA: alcohol dehydrogenase catalytic domain-containing protein [Acidimicrobiia bacterium]|nr:alcohol dehydrogenase catalytic domain-containing protein [Acidimicrobiia bacterium]